MLQSRRPSVSPNDTVDLQTHCAWFRIMQRPEWAFKTKGGCAVDVVGKTDGRDVGAEQIPT
jgi:hypothetical protein